MGRWMKSMDKDGNLVDEIAPHPLIYCSRYLPSSHRSSFPQLQKLEPESVHWIEEVQTIKGEELKQLIQEFQRIRRIVRLEEFLPGLDNKAFLERWNEYGAEFEEYLDEIERILLKAVSEDHMLRIFL